MTFKNLQDDLIEEVEQVLKDVVTTKTDGTEVWGIKGYRHQLPVIQTDEDDVSQYFPYFIVRFEGGETKEDNDPWHVSTQILFGIHDANASDGHEHVLICCQRVVDRFVSEPNLKAYRADQNIEWAVSDDDTYPFHFGGVSITFSVPKIGRKEVYC